MFLETLMASIQAIRANLLRSILTTLGIIVGVASTIAVVSVIQGFSYSVQQQFASLGSNSLTIESHTPFADRAQGKFSRLTGSDYQVVIDRIDGISHVTPNLWIPGGSIGGISYGSNTSSSNALATSANYIHLDNWYPQIGRFITPTDDTSRRKVAIIGSTVQKDLELPEDPRGEFITIANEWFKVIGVMEAKGKMLGFDQDQIVLIPYATGQSLLGQTRWSDIQISFRVINVDELDQIKERITRLLRKHRGLKPGEPNDFKISTPEQLLESFNQITNAITAILGGIVAISLLVGGIGIMNIMLVSVTERTKEIGINKALGATRSFIMMQFLTEAIILCIIGGIIGILLGWGIGLGVAAMIGAPSATVPLWAILLGLGFSASVGIIFGIIPASKASNLSPIDALRFL